MGWQEEYRAHFPSCVKCVYLDNAYDCGGTDFGISAMERYFEDWVNAAVNVERGGPGRAVHFKVIDETRKLIAGLTQAESPDLVAFTRNTNEGLNAILQGFPFEKEDNIVTDAVEHHSVIMPAVNLAKTKRIEVRVLAEDQSERILPEDLLALCDEHTRMVCVSHVQSATGYRMDLKALGEECHARGIFLVVDAIQSLGLMPFKMTDWHVDAVNAAGYKGLNAVNSIGFTVYSKELLKKIWPVYIAAGFVNDVIHTEDGWDLTCKDPENARKMENSSLDNPGIYVLHDSLSMLEEVGIENIYTHVESLYTKMEKGLKELGYDVLSFPEPEEHLASLVVQPAHAKELFEYFRSKNIAFSLSAGKYLRFSVAGFNNEEDIDTLLKAAAETELR